MPSSLEALERGWDQAAEHDARFNIITIHGLSEPDFWAMGRDEIGHFMRKLSGIAPGFMARRALDFGCGIGRLTLALAGWFDQVDGVDVSGEMIRQATALTTDPVVAYHHNPAEHLRIFDDDSFSLVYSSIVLQHMPSDLAAGYVREFLRVTEPGGYVAFQIPEGFNTAAHGSEWLAMYGTPRSVVESWVEAASLVDVEQNDASGSGFTSYRYLVRIDG